MEIGTNIRLPNLGKIYLVLRYIVIRFYSYRDGYMFDVDQIIEDYDRLLTEEREEYKVNELLDDFKSAYNVKEQTVKEHRHAIYEAKEIADRHWDCYEAFNIKGCDTLSLVTYELNEDIKASIFLSMHGLIDLQIFYYGDG